MYLLVKEANRKTEEVMTLIIPKPVPPKVRIEDLVVKPTPTVKDQIKKAQGKKKDKKKFASPPHMTVYPFKGLDKLLGMSDTK